MTDAVLFNAHLEGDAFFWEGGPVGVLLLHGFTATTAEVRPFGRYLQAKGFSVAGPLLAGHGTIPDDLNHTHWEDWVQSAEEAYQSLRKRCEKVFVVGESAGAVICLVLAIRHPEIDLLVLASPALKLNLTPFQALQLHLLAPVLKSVSKGPMDPSNNWKGYTVNPLKGTLQLVEMEQFVASRLPAINQPIQIFQGRLDRTIDLRSGEIILSKVCSKIKALEWMEASSHCVLLDPEKEQVFEKGLAFISEIYSGRLPFRAGEQQPAQG
jgi:carboxylesterase